MTYVPYDSHFANHDTSEFWESIRKFHQPENLEISYQTIPGPAGAPDIEIKIFRPRLEKALPMIMNIHGGGFVAGSYENDNNRCTNIALGVPAVVVSLNYRLAPTFTYREAIADCYQTWCWMHDHAEELGGIADQMGLHGTSAGGNMCAGLAFYVRDHGGPAIALNALNTPALGLGPTLSAEQMRFDGAIIQGDRLAYNVRLYLGGLDGSTPSYYAVPNAAVDFSELPPTLVIAAELDPLRDESTEYVLKLQKDAIPVEYYIMPRAMHGFTAVQCDMTHWIEEGMCRSFRREFAKVAKETAEKANSDAAYAQL